MDVQYGGGCKKHEFSLVGNSAIMKSYPPKRSCILVHEGENDMCRALVYQQLKFDISELVDGHEDSGVFLIFDNHNILAGKK